MNDKKAKLLRKTVYGHDPLRIERQYETLANGQVINVYHSLRAIYQGAKKLYRERNKCQT